MLAIKKTHFCVRIRIIRSPAGASLAERKRRRGVPEITTLGSSCEQCNHVFIARVAGQRFCCRQCSDAWWTAEHSRAMAERRERQTATCFGRAPTDQPDAK